MNHYKNGLLRASGDYPNTTEEEIGVSEKQLSNSKLMAIIEAYGRNSKTGSVLVRRGSITESIVGLLMRAQ